VEEKGKERIYCDFMQNIPTENLFVQLIMQKQNKKMLRALV
jgi:hypothetical protein